MIPTEEQRWTGKVAMVITLKRGKGAPEISEVTLPLEHIVNRMFTRSTQDPRGRYEPFDELATPDRVGAIARANAMDPPTLGPILSGVISRSVQAKFDAEFKAPARIVWSEDELAEERQWRKAFLTDIRRPLGPERWAWLDRRSQAVSCEQRSRMKRRAEVRARMLKK